MTIHTSLESAIRVGINPNMHPSKRHGTVVFEVSGFGRMHRDFMVDAPEVLARDLPRYVNDIAKQIMLLDKTLPKKEQNCTPINIDIVIDGQRRIFEYGSARVLFEQL